MITLRFFFALFFKFFCGKRKKRNAQVAFRRRAKMGINVESGKKIGKKRQFARFFIKNRLKTLSFLREI